MSPDADLHLELLRDGDPYPARIPGADLRAVRPGPTSARTYLTPPTGGYPLATLFWYFGHPEAYIVALPFFGIVTEIISVFAREPHFGYASQVAMAGCHPRLAEGRQYAPGAAQLSWSVAGREWPDLRPRDRAGRRTSPWPGLRRARACLAPRTGVWHWGRWPARPGTASWPAPIG